MDAARQERSYLAVLRQPGSKLSISTSLGCNNPLSLHRESITGAWLWWFCSLSIRSWHCLGQGYASSITNRGISLQKNHHQRTLQRTNALVFQGEIQVVPNTQITKYTPSKNRTGDEADHVFPRSSVEACQYQKINLQAEPPGRRTLGRFQPGAGTPVAWDWKQSNSCQ